MKCFSCQSLLPVNPPNYTGGAGYGINKSGNKICYSCCAEEDKKQMNETGQIILYFNQGCISNWPGTLRFIATGYNYSKNNWGCQRQDVWFNFNEFVWHGVNLGDNDILRCKRTKKKS